MQTGFRLPPTGQEQGWLDSFQPVAELSVGPQVTLESLPDLAPNETELEYAREPPAELAPFFSRLGHSQDRRALVFCSYQLFVIPADRIICFEVNRLLPAKGPGGATLSVACHTRTKVSFTKITMTRTSAANGLNEAGRIIANALGKPLAIEAYDHDV